MRSGLNEGWRKIEDETNTKQTQVSSRRSLEGQFGNDEAGRGRRGDGSEVDD
jgi:hypothetical protein